MLGSQILEVAIGTIFVYLLLSLICSAFSELVEAKLKNRATDLERGVRTLLDNAQLTKMIYEHPLVNGLYEGAYRVPSVSIAKRLFWKNDLNLPSYIPSRNFALALLSTVFSDFAAGATGTPEAVREKVNGLTEAHVAAPVKRVLVALAEDAKGDVGRLRAGVEAWFDGGMDRVSGWYKRRVQIITLVTGIGVTVAFNADSLTIVGSLSHDPALRDSLVAAAQEYARQIPAGAGGAGPLEAKIERERERIRKLGLPLGWSWEADDPRGLPRTAGAWVNKIIGLILTAFAISLGAPFWFDTLNRFVVVRSTVKPHEKSPEESSKQ